MPAPCPSSVNACTNMLVSVSLILNSFVFLLHSGLAWAVLCFSLSPSVPCTLVPHYSGDCVLYKPSKNSEGNGTGCRYPLTMT